MSTQPNLIQQLHAATVQATDSGWSINRIAHEAGISRPSLQSWFTGAQRSIDLETATRLAAWLGMRLTAPKIPKSDTPPPSRRPSAKSTKPKSTRKRKNVIGG